MELTEGNDSELTLYLASCVHESVFERYPPLASTLGRPSTLPVIRVLGALEA